MISFTYMSGFLAVLDGQPSMGDNIQTGVVGFLVVLIALATIWVCLEVIGFFFKRANKVPAKATASTSGGAPAPQNCSLDSDIVMVIAAAVDSVVTEPHRIVSISLADEGTSGSKKSH